MGGKVGAFSYGSSKVPVPLSTVSVDVYSIYSAQELVAPSIHPSGTYVTFFGELEGAYSG